MEIRKNALALLVLVVCSCSEKNQQIAGIYLSDNPNNMNQGIDYVLFKTVYLTGVTLELKEDSTVRFESCAMFGTGTWKLKKDSILVFCSQRRFKIDSLNRSGKFLKDLVCPDKPDVYVVNGDILEKNHKAKGLLVVEKLQKKSK